MRAYRVNVNGTTYEITVEEIGGRAADYSASPSRAVPSRAPAPARVAPPARTATPVRAPASAPAASAATSAGGEQICAPMPGNVWQVLVSDGQSVKKGDVLMILEAMKMENEIMAPREGVVASVSVSKGDAVGSGALLCIIR